MPASTSTAPSTVLIQVSPAAFRAERVIPRGGGHSSPTTGVYRPIRRPGRRVKIGALEIEPHTRRVRLAGADVELTRLEFDLLLKLARDPARVFTKDELLRAVWGFNGDAGTRTLDTHACRLRGKLSRAGGRYVISVWGVGYRLLDGVQPE